MAIFHFISLDIPYLKIYMVEINFKHLKSYHSGVAKSLWIVEFLAASKSSRTASTSTVLPHHMLEQDTMYQKILLCKGTYIQLYKHLHVHSHTHAHAHTHIHTHTYTYTYTHTHTHTHTHMHTHTIMHTLTHARVHTRTHKCTHAHTHEHTQENNSIPVCHALRVKIYIYIITFQQSTPRAQRRKKC